MPSHEFAGLADDDVAAIIANLRSRPPVDHVTLATRLGPIARGLMLANKMVLLPNDEIDHARVTLARAPTGGTIEQGRYLAAGCTGCHGNNYGGQPMPGGKPGDKPSANLTPSGNMGHWSQAEFVKVIREGTRPDGTKLVETMPWKAFSNLSDEALQGLYLYLKSLPPTPVIASK